MAKHNHNIQRTSRRLRNSYISTIVSISLVLFMLGLMASLLINTSKLSRYIKEHIGFDVVLYDNSTDADIAWVRKQLDIAPYVRETKFVSKEDAEKELREMLGEDFVAFLGYNPLPMAIETKLRYNYANPDSVQKIEQELLTIKQVKEIRYQPSVLQFVHENEKKISAVLLLFSGLLLIVSLAQISNTIRLSIYSRRFLINTMRLVGATRFFIIRPFVAKSALHGMVSALLAFGLLLALYSGLKGELGQEMGNLINLEMGATLFFVLMFLGILMTASSTYFAVNRFLDMEADELYY